MRFLAPLAPLALAALACACGSSSTTADASTDAPIDTSFPDVPPVNACLAYGPAGAACLTGGVCGEGNVNDTDYLCLSSIEICCVPAVALNIDSGVEGLPDGNFVVPRDGGPDAVAGQHDAGQGGHDAGHGDHDAAHGSHDAGHDGGGAAHDSGGAHDAASDAPRSMTAG